LESLPERWHGSVDYWRWLLGAYAREKASPDLLERAGNEFLKRIPRVNDPGGNERYPVADLWLANGVDPLAADRVAREAVAISEVGDCPAVTYTDERQRRIRNRLLIRNINRSALGWSLYQQGKYPEALAELQHAARIAEQDSLPTRAVYYRMGQTLEKLNRPQEALTACCKELAWGDYEKPTKSAVAVVYRQLLGSPDGQESVERTQVNELAAQRAERDSDLVSEVDEDLGRVDLLDESGAPLDLKRYRGRIVAIDFWATWCGICRPMMQQTGELQHRFGDRVAVVAPALDPEETHAQAVEFLKKMNYGFMLASTTSGAATLNCRLFPHGCCGRLRFMEFGHSIESAALFEKKLAALAAAGSPR
jgi:thiol-disulfide isomerase/thioredoxin